MYPTPAGADTPAPNGKCVPWNLAGLLESLQEIQRTTATLIDQYHARLALGGHSGGKLRRWQLRTQAALRAVEKAKAKTAASIRKLRRHLGSPT